MRHSSGSGTDPVSLLPTLGVWDIQPGQQSPALPMPPRSPGDSSLQVVLPTAQPMCQVWGSTGQLLSAAAGLSHHQE